MSVKVKITVHENNMDISNDGCNKKIEFQVKIDNDYIQNCVARCGWSVYGKQRYCEECQEKINKLINK